MTRCVAVGACQGAPSDAVLSLPGQYKHPAIKAMVDTPQDRPAELRKAIEAFGGRLHQFFFAFGEYDGVSIVEFPQQRELCGMRCHAHRGRR